MNIVTLAMLLPPTQWVNTICPTLPNGKYHVNNLNDKKDNDNLQLTRFKNIFDLCKPATKLPTITFLYSFDKIKSEKG